MLEDGEVRFFINGREVASARTTAAITLAGCTLHTQGVVSIVPLPTPSSVDPAAGAMRHASPASAAAALVGRHHPQLRLLPTRAALTVLHAVIGDDTGRDSNENEGGASLKISREERPVELWESALEMVTQCCDISSLGERREVMQRLLSEFIRTSYASEESVASMRNLLSVVADTDSSAINRCVVDAILSVESSAGPSGRWRAHAVGTLVGFVTADAGGTSNNGDSGGIETVEIVRCVLASARAAASLTRLSPPDPKSTELIVQHMQLIQELLRCGSAGKTCSLSHASYNHTHIHTYTHTHTHTYTHTHTHTQVTGETHTVVFTAGATASLKLVAESYAFGRGAVFAYMRECHTSAVGARGIAHARGVPAPSFTESDVVEVSHDASSAVITSVGSGSSGEPDSDPSNGPSLVVFPGQSNFCGRKYPLRWVTALQAGEADVLLRGAPVCPTHGHSRARGSRDDGTTKNVASKNSVSCDFDDGNGGGEGGGSASTTSPRRRAWRVLLDGAALVSTSPLNLAEVHDKLDFMPCAHLVL